MSDSKPTRRLPAARTIALRMATYFVAAWGTIAILAAGAFPGAAVVVLALAGVLGVLVGAPFGHGLALGRGFALVVFGAFAALLAAGYIGSRRLVVRRVDAFVPGLASTFDGLRIAQLSDLHVGPHSSRRFLDRVVRATHSLSPDIVAITGDLVDDRAEDVAIYARMLGSLAAPLGVFMIPGNHDVYAGWDDVDRALADVPASTTVIAFAHNPALWPALAARGVALTLSGHTHWGQFALPSLGWSLASPFLAHAMGAHTQDDAVLYISPGTGYWGIPFRIGARPEVTLVTLRRAETASARVHRPRSACRLQPAVVAGW